MILVIDIFNSMESWKIIISYVKIYFIATFTAFMFYLYEGSYSVLAVCLMTWDRCQSKIPDVRCPIPIKSFNIENSLL